MDNISAKELAGQIEDIVDEYIWTANPDRSQCIADILKLCYKVINSKDYNETLP